MNLKSLSLAVSTLLICSSAFATALNIQVKDNANGELWQGGLNAQSVFSSSDKKVHVNKIKNGFTLTPMEFNANNQKNIAGMVTVMVDNVNNGIRIDCILSDRNKNQLTFTPVYSYGQGVAFTCKPTNDSQSAVIEDKDNVKTMKIIYKKYVQ